MREYECVGNSISIRVLRMITGMSTCMSMSKSMDVSESKLVHQYYESEQQHCSIKIGVCLFFGARALLHTYRRALFCKRDMFAHIQTRPHKVRVATTVI